MTRHHSTVRLPAVALLLIAAITLPATAAAAPPPDAAALLAKAESQAAASGQNIFLIFGASWCGWCKVLATFLRQPQVAPILNKQFTFLDLTVEEQGPKAQLDNPGAQELMESLGGRDGSLPFIAILDPSGKLIVNSDNTDARPPGNIGYPVQPGEVAWFMQMLQRGATRLQPAQLLKLHQVLESFAAKYRH